MVEKGAPGFTHDEPEDKHGIRLSNTAALTLNNVFVDTDRLIGSTGPQTIEGKARVASNALKHGLTGELIVLPGEDPNKYDEFLAHMIATLAPMGAVEEVVAEKMVADAWRRKRVPALEAAVHRRKYLEDLIDQAKEEVETGRGILNLAQRELDAAQEELSSEDGLDATDAEDSGRGRFHGRRNGGGGGRRGRRNKRRGRSRRCRG